MRVAIKVELKEMIRELHKLGMSLGEAIAFSEYNEAEIQYIREDMRFEHGDDYSFDRLELEARELELEGRHQMESEYERLLGLDRIYG